MKPLFAILAPLLVLTGCAQPIKQPLDGYLCCNVTSSGGWVSSDTTLGGGMVLPFGEPVTVTSIKRSRYAYGTVGGQGIGFSDDSAKSLPETLAWLHTIVVSEDPRKAFDTWPAAVRTAVSTQRITLGMTRAQVAMAIGHPARSQTATLDAPTWTYWSSVDDNPVVLTFDASGVLSDVQGRPAALRLVFMPQ